MTNEDKMLQGRDPTFAKMFAIKSAESVVESDSLDEKKKGAKSNATLVEVESMLDITTVCSLIFFL